MTEISTVLRLFQRGAQGRPACPWRQWLLVAAAVLMGLSAQPCWCGIDPPVDVSQIEKVRDQIRTLEGRLAGLEQASQTAKEEKERLDTEVELAEARVKEIELELTRSRDEAIRLKESAAGLSSEMAAQKKNLATYVELATLLGQPGPLQLIWDGARGGDLEHSLGVVLTIAEGQARMVAEFRILQNERSRRLGELSRLLERAGKEADELIKRRRELSEVKREVTSRLKKLERQHSQADHQLADLKAREAALERLFSVVGQKKRMTGGEDIRRFRGALPWPASGAVIRTFGKHFLPKYATYTVCNGLRFSVERGTPVQAVFPGQVAFAQHFRGYGNMVVVDHGHEVFSLVAGLSSIHARLDQRVEMGTRLGIVGAEGDDGNLYLEIRVEGEPQNPKGWLQLAGQ